MRKIIVQEMISADGFFAGPNGELDWHVVEAEFQEYAIGMLKSMDTILFGRVTYDLMAEFWSSAIALEGDPITAELMNSLPKIVFSKTQTQLPWNNTTVMKEIVPEEIMKLKQRPGKDIVILGSGTIVSAFAEHGLVDEYRLIVNPVVLGKGKTLFAGITKPIKFTLTNTRTLASGNVLLYYEPK